MTKTCALDASYLHGFSCRSDSSVALFNPSQTNSMVCSECCKNHGAVRVQKQSTMYSKWKLDTHIREPSFLRRTNTVGCTICSPISDHSDHVPWQALCHYHSYCPAYLAQMMARRPRCCRIHECPVYRCLAARVHARCSTLTLHASAA